jgi:pyroglutamyl-peptidase
MSPPAGSAGRIKVLATGFLPFGGDLYNASGVAAHWLHKQRIHGVGPRGYIDAVIVGVGDVPVVGAADAVASGHRAAADVVIQAIIKHHPEVVVCFGQGDKTTFSVELVARDQPDTPENPAERNKYVSYHDPRISRDPHTGYHPSYDTTFDKDRILAAIKSVGGDVQPSEDAGAYVCEDVLYHVLRYAQQNVADVRILAAGFVHVPRWVRVDVKHVHYYGDEIRHLPGFGSTDFVPNDNGKAPADKCVPQSLINLAAYKAVEAAVMGVRAVAEEVTPRGSPSLELER